MKTTSRLAFAAPCCAAVLAATAGEEAAVRAWIVENQALVDGWLE